MTQNKTETPEDKPMGIYLSLNSALSVANWIAPTDVAAMTLARRIALALDTAFDMGDLKEATPLAAKYLQVLQQLHLTVETRTLGKQGEENQEKSGHSRCITNLVLLKSFLEDVEIDGARRVHGPTICCNHHCVEDLE